MSLPRVPELDAIERRWPGLHRCRRPARLVQRAPTSGSSFPRWLRTGSCFSIPTVRAFYLSFFDWTGVGPQETSSGSTTFRRFAPARTASGGRRGNSLELFAFIFIFQNTVSLGLALMLNRRSRMTHIYRAIIFLPVIMSAVATGILWILMLDPIIGIVNPVLRDIGLGSWQREWQADPSLGDEDRHGRPGLAMERDGRRPLSGRVCKTSLKISGTPPWSMARTAGRSSATSPSRCSPRPSRS